MPAKPSTAPHCPICDRASRPRRSAVANYALHVCPECRLEFLYPQPDDSVLAAIYGDGYFLGDQDDAAVERRSRMKSATGALYVDALAKIVAPAESTLLEIGCGHGEVLMEARRRGFRVAGIEISAHAASAANHSLGEPVVRVGALETLAPGDRQFDAVLAAHVIEHVRNPKAFLMRIEKLLSPAGTLLLVTPSLDSWTRRILRGRWMEYKVEHLTYFSGAAIRLMLEQCGFGNILVLPNRKVLTIDYICRHFDRFRVPLWSPLAGVLRRVVPARLAQRHLLIPASGLLVIARKA